MSDTDPDPTGTVSLTKADDGQPTRVGILTAWERRNKDTWVRSSWAMVFLYTALTAVMLIIVALGTVKLTIKPAVVVTTKNQAGAIDGLKLDQIGGVLQHPDLYARIMVAIPGTLVVLVSGAMAWALWRFARASAHSSPFDAASSKKFTAANVLYIAVPMATMLVKPTADILLSHHLGIGVGNLRIDYSDALTFPYLYVSLLSAVMFSSTMKDGQRMKEKMDKVMW